MANYFPLAGPAHGPGAAGQNIFIQFHLGVDGQLSLYRAHRIGKEVEAKVLNVFPQAEIIIHQDPIDKDKEDSLG